MLSLFIHLFVLQNHHPIYFQMRCERDHPTVLFKFQGGVEGGRPETTTARTEGGLLILPGALRPRAITNAERAACV